MTHMRYMPIISSTWLWFGSLIFQLLPNSSEFALAFCVSPVTIADKRIITFFQERKRHRYNEWKRNISSGNSQLPVQHFSTNIALHSSGDYSDSSGDSLVDDTADMDLGDDLTKYELGLRLKEVRDYYRDTNEMSQENVCLSLIRTRLPKLRLNRCYVADSTISGAGRGLFALRDIEEGELITLYPGDILLQWEKSVGDFSGEVGVLFGNHVRKEDQQMVADRLTTDSARSYEMTIGPRHSVVGDPLQSDYPAYLGHIANDAAILTRRDQGAVDEYVRKSNEGHNAANLILEGSHFVTVATKNITKGQEIFISYGYQYWFSRSVLNSKKGAENKKVSKKGNKKPTKKKKSGNKKGFGKN